MYQQRSSCFGIYFGNSSMCLAFYKDGNASIVTNDSGERVTPAVVAVSDLEVSVGQAAKSTMSRCSDTIALCCKKLVNRNIPKEEVTQICSVKEMNLTYEEGRILYSLTNIMVSPRDIATMLFKHLYEIAARSTHKTNLGVVIAVPVHFLTLSRQTISRIGDAAGFTVLQIINEPSAAMLSYEIGFEKSENFKVLVYRLGGVTCDVSVVTVADGLYSIDANVYKSNLGGDKFTLLLADYIASEFYQKFKLDPKESIRSMIKLRQYSEDCKRVLSTVYSSRVFIESLFEGVDCNQTVTRSRFESLISGHLDQYKQPITEVLEKANVASIDILKVVLCGGSVKIPKLQSFIAGMFPEAEILSARPDEVIAEGAAIQGSFLKDRWDIECLTLSIPVLALQKPITIVETCVGKTKTIDKLTTIPCTIDLSELKTADGKYSFLIFQDEGENEELSQLDLVGYTNQVPELYIDKENCTVRLRDIENTDG